MILKKKIHRKKGKNNQLKRKKIIKAESTSTAEADTYGVRRWPRKSALNVVHESGNSKEVKESFLPLATYVLAAS